MSNIKKIALVCAGIAIALALGSTVTKAEPEVKEKEAVVLGHRIGPGGQEMLVIR